MFIAALFTVARIRKQPKGPSIDSSRGVKLIFTGATSAPCCLPRAKYNFKTV